MEGSLGEIFVLGGLADVGPDSLTILSEQAVPLADVDRSYLAQEIKNAEEDLADAQDEDKQRQATDTLERLRSLSEALDMAA
jgi:F-type H+-transporting ATPase subunit epsilon